MDVVILRSWRGATRGRDADRYHEYLLGTGVETMRGIPGNRGVYVLRKREGDLAEFQVLSLWDSMEAVHAFAGERPDRAVFYPEDERFLVRADPHVDHWEVLTSPIATRPG